MEAEGLSGAPSEAPTTVAEPVRPVPPAPPGPVRQAPPVESTGPIVPRRLRAPSKRRLKRQRQRSVPTRRVQRVVRRVDPWSVLKFSAVLYVCLWVVLLTAAVILWAAAAGAGAIENVEDFIKELFGLDSFAFEPGELLRGCFIGGLILVVAGTAGTVLMSVLFNLISDIVGGVRVTMLEEEPARRPPSKVG